MKYLKNVAVQCGFSSNIFDQAVNKFKHSNYKSTLSPIETSKPVNLIVLLYFKKIVLN